MASTPADTAKGQKSEAAAVTTPAREETMASTSAGPAKGRKSEAAAVTTPARETMGLPPAGKEKEETPAPAAKATKNEKKNTPAYYGSDDSGSDDSRSDDSGSDVPGSDDSGSDDSGSDHFGSDESEKSSCKFRSSKRLNSKICNKIPWALREWIVDDWDQVTRKQKLAILPAKQNVSQIIDCYLDFKKKSLLRKRAKKLRFTDITEPMEAYFNAIVGTQLLYASERPQFDELRQEYPDKQLSEIYGSIHLLRLFTRMGNMLAYTDFDDKTLQNILESIQDFLDYMVSMRATLFSLNAYRDPVVPYESAEA